MLYIRKLFTQDLRDGKQIAFPKEPSYSFFSFDYSNKEPDRFISFKFRARFEEFEEYEGKTITTRLYAAGSESRMDGEVKAFIRDELNAKVNDLLIFKNIGTQHINFEFMFVPQHSPFYPLLYKLCGGDNHTIYSLDDRSDESDKCENLSSLPLQQIYFGAPGTGKSHEIKEKTKGKAVVRTTFHPDSDYSTFVGAYKPTMEDADTQVIPVVVDKGISLEPAGTYKEKKIVYKFIPQAFLKAYLGAWKKYADWKSPTTSNQKKKITFSTKIGGDYVILSVGDSSLKFSRSFDFTKKAVAKEWPKLWNNDLFSIPNGPQSGASVQHAIALWIKDNISPCTQNDFEKGWDAMMDKIRTEGSVEASKQQTYIITNIEGTTNKIRVKVEEAGKSKDSLKNVFNGSPSQFELENKLVEILKQYSATSFDEAWEQLKEDVETGTQTNLAITYKPQFLVIEEINRGNCAQIFGDLFQLLDRGDNGFSEYPIEADSDLQQEIERAFKEDKDYKLNGNIDIEGVIEGYTSNYGATLSKDVQSGRVLLLPKNLYIWATMNTSDQSLFPIDSAFKRRWDWKYIPINYEKERWLINVLGEPYNWSEFLKKMNAKISSTTHSEDKKLGYYFCKAKDNIIDAETFVGKVIFYVWNDVFKDFAEEAGDLFKDENGDLLSYEKFYGVGDDGNTKVLEDRVALFLEHLEVKPVEETNSDDVEDEDEEEIAGNQRKETLVSIQIPNNPTINSSDSTQFDAFVKALKTIGIERIIPIAGSLKYQRLGCPVLSTQKDSRIENNGDGYSYQQEGELFIIKGCKSYTYIRILEDLNKLLNVGLSLETK